MANKRHKPEEIVSKLRQVDVLVGQRMARVGSIRQYNHVRPHEALSIREPVPETIQRTTN